MKKISILTVAAIIISTLISGCAGASESSVTDNSSVSTEATESTPEATSATTTETKTPEITISENSESTDDSIETTTTLPQSTPAPETTTAEATTTIPETTPAPETTTTSPETTTDPPETTIKAPETAPSNEAKPDPNANYFTTEIEGNTSMGCFTYEGKKGVWAHLLNPYNAVSLYSPISPGKMDADTKNIVICFNVSGLTEEITAFCGLLAYGTGEDDEELSVWDNDTYNSLTGEDFEFSITMNGYHEMVVPVSKLAAGLDYWEGLSYTSIVEIAFYGAEGIDSDGKYTGALKDGLSFEFYGIKAE